MKSIRSHDILPKPDGDTCMKGRGILIDTGAAKKDNGYRIEIGGHVYLRDDLSAAMSEVHALLTSVKVKYTCLKPWQHFGGNTETNIISILHQSYNLDEILIIFGKKTVNVSPKEAGRLRGRFEGETFRKLSEFGYPDVGPVITPFSTKAMV